MKKLLVVLLAVVMVFGFASTAFAADTLATAYPDLSGKDTTVQDAFMKLSALDVFDGYPDGTIKPDANITRAEFAKIACILSGMADSADVLKGNASKFSDVPANQWYTGYVNLATSLQFVSGYPDGTFKPNNYITMQEALTVLLRITGYNDNLVGPWPMNYIAQGGKLDVTDDVAFAGAAPATRAAIAVMAANVLDVNVVYWDSDKAKFVEDTQIVEVIRLKGVKYEEVEVPITVLEEKFGAGVVNDAYVFGWYFDDYDDQELILTYMEDRFFFKASASDFSTMMKRESTAELAEKYWVSDGLDLSNFYYYQANLILNDDDEIVYVDITSSSEYSDDVTVDGDTVEVNGASKKVADHAWLPDDDDYTAQVFYNDDNEVYLVRECYFREQANENGAPYIFKTYNEAKDRIETYNGKNIDTDVDLAILKDGRFITPADLTDKDVLYFYDYNDIEELGADALIFVTSFKEGELTKGTSSKLTVGGTALDYTYGADYSTDGLETFALIDSPDDVDDAYGTTVQYATTFFNPYDLCLMLYDGGASNTIYGVITDVSANIDGQVSAITVLGADGEEVEYTLVKGDTNGRPEYHNYDEMYDDYYTDDFDLSFGTYIEAKVSEDGAIDTDDIKALVGPVYYSDDVLDTADWSTYYSFYPWVYDLNDSYDGIYSQDYVWSDVDYENAIYGYDSYDINKNRIRVDGVYYTLTDDTLVFQTTTTTAAPIANVPSAPGEFDKAEVIDVADIMAADEISAGAVAAFIEDGVVQQLFLLDTDINSTSNYGVLDDAEYRSGDWYGTLLGGSEYKMDEYWSGIVDTYFFAYTISGGELVPDYPIVWVDGSHASYDPGVLPSGELVDGYVAGDVATNGDILILDGKNFTTNDDTVFYKIEDGEITEGDIYDLEDGQTPVIIITTDDPDDDILAYVFVLIDATFFDD